MTDMEQCEHAMRDDSRATKECQYWWLNANPKIWSFSDLQVGEVQDYIIYNDNGNKRRVFR